MLVTQATSGVALHIGLSNLELQECRREGAREYNDLVYPNILPFLLAAYAPINLCSVDEINLVKLQCHLVHEHLQLWRRYPTRWNYGIALKYNFNIDNNNFPTTCVECDQSKGVYGFTGMYNSFTRELWNKHLIKEV